MAGAPQLCFICQKHFIHQRDVSLLKTSFGTLDEIHSRINCTICSFLYAALRNHIHEPLVRGNDDCTDVKVGCWLRTYIQDPTEVLVIYDGMARFACRLLFDISYFELWKRWKASAHMPVLPRLRDWPYVGEGLTINPEWIRGFLNSCCNARLGGLHSASKGCGSRDASLEPMKLDLIDVNELCLVRSNTLARYASLSYEWGRASVIKSTKENRDALAHPGIFARTPPAPIVQDAIELVRSIGERYLWVDSLCIPQNNAKLTAFYVNRMDYIYSQSVITIVAASSKSAMDRLPGVRPGSRGPQYTPKIGDMRLVLKTRELEEPLEESTYESRAWTFQERLLSNRCLIMTDLEAFLCCPSLLFSELYGSLPEACKRFHPLRQLTPTRAEYDSQRDMVSYRDLVVDFTSRHLTYEGDILRAFAGISAFLESKMRRGGMLFGLPTPDLALALSWTPRGPATRRNSCTSPYGPGDLALPSWTWAGWTGRKDWPLPFAFFESDSTISAFSPDIDDFKIEADTQWQDVHTNTLLHTTPSTISRLRFMARWLDASYFRYTTFEEEDLNESYQLKRRHHFLELLVHEITGHGNGKHCRGGLVFGIETEQLDDPTTAFIALGRWTSDDLPTGYNFTRTPRKPAQKCGGGPFSVQVCLVAQWTDRKRAFCERIGVAHVEGRLWDEKMSESRRGIVHLA